MYYTMYDSPSPMTHTLGVYKGPVATLYFPSFSNTLHTPDSLCLSTIAFQPFAYRLTLEPNTALHLYTATTQP